MGLSGHMAALSRLADRCADLATVPSRAAKRAAVEIEALIEDEFDAGTDPYGTAWAPLAEATVDRGRSPPPLTDTAAMRQSVAVRPMRGAGVAVTVAHPAGIHQTGWSGKGGKGPARPILPQRRALPEDWRDAIADAVEVEYKR